jgi:hypothetical protein
MSYYFSKKKDLNGKIKQLKIDHDISDIKSLSSLTLVNRIKNKDQKFWNTATGDFGEACLAWRLEEGILKDDIFWAPIRFISSPLKEGEGVDLMGIQKSNMKICFGESKFRNSIDKSEIKETVKKLSEQLYDSRLDEILNGEHGGFSYNTYQSLEWLKGILMVLIDEGKLPFDQKILDKVFTTKGYSKFGAIIRPMKSISTDELYNQAFELIDKHCKKNNECSNACDDLCKKRNPVTLIDFQMECLMLEIEAFLRSLLKEQVI